MALRIPPSGAPTVIEPADGVALTPEEIRLAVGGPYAGVALSARFFRGDILFCHADNTFAPDRRFNCAASDMVSHDVWGAVVVAARSEVVWEAAPGVG